MRPIPPQFFTQAIHLMQNDQIYACQIGFAAGHYEELSRQAPQFLHMEELIALQKLQHKRQFSFLLGKYSGKNTIAHYRDLDNLNIFQIKSGSFNQPVLSGYGTEETAISLSHCDNISACIVFPSTVVMGIDIEQAQTKYENMLHQQMTEEEINLITQLNVSESQTRLIRLWTIKEALGKALKTGLTIDLRLLSVNAIENKGQYWISTFQHFSQYHAYTFAIFDYIFTVVLPKTCTLSLNLPEIRTWFANSKSLITS